MIEVKAHGYVLFLICLVIVNGLIGVRRIQGILWIIGIIGWIVRSLERLSVWRVIIFIFGLCTDRCIIFILACLCLFGYLIVSFSKLSSSFQLLA